MQLHCTGLPVEFTQPRDYSLAQPCNSIYDNKLKPKMSLIRQISYNEKNMFTYQGQHGSTFGGSALSCKVAMASLRVMEDEGLAENAEVLGRMFRCDTQYTQYGL